MPQILILGGFEVAAAHAVTIFPVHLLSSGDLSKALGGTSPARRIAQRRAIAAGVGARRRCPSKACVLVIEGSADNDQSAQRTTDRLRPPSHV